MNNVFRLSIFAAAAVLCASCAKEMAVSSADSSTLFPEVTLSVCTEETRTALQPDCSVVFNAGDSIRVYGKTSHTFLTESTGSNVDFTGTLADDDTTDFCAFYPYKSFSSSNGAGVYSVTIPNCQVGVPSGFDPSAQVMVARKSGDRFDMYNVCALVKLTLTSSDITSVTLCNAAGVKIAGKLDVTIPESGAPTIGEASYENIVLFPSAEVFTPGDYYIAVAPAALTGGLQLMFTRSADDAIATKKGTNAATFYRSELLKLGTVDSDLVWTPIYKAKVSFWEDDDFHNPTSLTKFSKTIGSPNYPNQYVVLRDTASNLGVPYYSTGGFVGGSYGFRMVGDETSYFKFPVINGLTPVAFRAAAGADKDYFSLRLYAGSEPARGGDPYSVQPSKGTKYTWFIVNPDSSTEYSIHKAAAKELRTLSWEFIYTGTPEPTVSVVSLSTSTDITSTGATFNGKYYTYNNADVQGVTCGFEYKSDGDWTSVQCAEAAADFSCAVTGLTSGVEYTYRAWTADAKHKVYSEEKTFIPGGEVTYTIVMGYKTLDKEASGIESTSWLGKEIPCPALTGNHNVYTIYVKDQQLSTKTTKFELWAGNLKFSYSAAGSYVKLPALNGLKLTKVSVTTKSGSTSSGKWGIYDGNYESAKAVSGGSLTSYGTTSSEDQVNNFTLKNTVVGKSYLLYTGSNKNTIYVTTLSLTYEGNETATAQFVYTPSFADGTVSSKMLFNTVTKDTDITCGFEYKAGGAGDFVSLAAGVPGTLAEGVSTATASASLAAGDIVRAWASIDGGATKIYSPEKTISE